MKLIEERPPTLPKKRVGGRVGDQPALPPPCSSLSRSRYPPGRVISFGHQEMNQRQPRRERWGGNGNTEPEVPSRRFRSPRPPLVPASPSTIPSMIGANSIMVQLTGRSRLGRGSCRLWCSTTRQYRLAGRRNRNT